MANQVKPPPATHFVPAVDSFVSGGQLVALGNTSKKGQDADVKVSFTTKHRSTELPCLGFRVELILYLFKDSALQHLFSEYHYKTFESAHRKANSDDRTEFLNLIRSSRMRFPSSSSLRFFKN